MGFFCDCSIGDWDEWPTERFKNERQKVEVVPMTSSSLVTKPGTPSSGPKKQLKFAHVGIAAISALVALALGLSPSNASSAPSVEGTPASERVGVMPTEKTLSNSAANSPVAKPVAATQSQEPKGSPTLAGTNTSSSPLDTIVDNEGETTIIDTTTGRKATGVVSLPDPTGEALTNEEIASTCKNAGAISRKCYERALLAVLRQDGLTAVIAQFKKLIEDDPAAQVDCHLTAHELGRVSIELAGGILSKVAPKLDLMCSMGFVHGALIGRMQLFTPAELQTEVPKLCVARTQEEANGIEFYNCIHGVGHALLLVTENLNKALKLCDTLEPLNAVAGMDVRDRCGQGVFMQNTQNYREGAPMVTKTSDPLFPCNVAPKHQLQGCWGEQVFHYMVTRSVHDYKVAAIEVCDKAPKDYVYYCYQNLATLATTEARDEPAKMVELCTSFTSEVGKLACAEATPSTYVMNRDSPKWADEFCKGLPDEYQKPCLKVRNDRWTSIVNQKPLQVDPNV
jgi:hypothetical protein